MFFATFALALGSNPRHIGDIPFITFLAPGLIMMATTQNAFANTSSSIMISKIQGNIIDMLMPPISAGEFLFAYAMAGVTRSEEHTSELQSLMRNSYAVFCLKKKKSIINTTY